MGAVCFSRQENLMIGVSILRAKAADILRLWMWTISNFSKISPGDIQSVRFMMIS